MVFDATESLVAQSLYVPRNVDADLKAMRLRFR